MAGLFRAKWTDEIHDEWIRNLLINRQDLTSEKLERTRRLMDQAVMDALITDYQDLVPSLTLPDANDRHVLAAAIKTGAQGIITFNLKDFPASTLARYDIEAQHPDEFIVHQFNLDQAKVVIAAQRCRQRLKNPTKTAEEYLERLEEQSLPLTVAELKPFAAVL
jgi:PIN domain